MDRKEPLTLPEEDKKKVDTFWDNPLNVLHLIDLLFLNNERSKYLS